MNKRTAQLIEQVHTHLSRLPEDKVAEVLDFVQYLTARNVPPEHPNRGSLEALKECIGIWQFEPGELDQILTDIEQSRLMEMDEDNDQLPT